MAQQKKPRFNFELREVRATDDIMRSPGRLNAVMQPGQRYLWPESAVSAIIMDGVHDGLRYFEGTQHDKIFVEWRNPDGSEMTAEEKAGMFKRWEEVMRTDPAKHILSHDTNRTGIRDGSYHVNGSKVWRGQSLNGRRVLICGAYSIGDQLWYTHTAMLLKRKYPTATIYSLTYGGYGSGIWDNNPNAFDLTLPITTDCFESFDFYIPLLGIVSNQIDPVATQQAGKIMRSVRTPYEDFAAMMGLSDLYDPSEAHPYLSPDANAWFSFCQKVTMRFLTGWGTAAEPVEPKWPIVVQLHSQKPSRDFSVPQLVDILQALREEYKGILIYVIGDGERGAAQWKGISDACDVRSMGIIPILSGVVGGGYSFKEIAELIAHAQLVVSPDSMPCHLSAAYRIPNVAVFGPYAPEWRTTTYPFCHAFHVKSVCSLAPCAWPAQGFPDSCPSAAEGVCAVTTAPTGMEIVAAARGLMERKREEDPEWGIIHAQEVLDEATASLPDEPTLSVLTSSEAP